MGDQPQQWWSTFKQFLISDLGFEQHPMDPCVFMLREPVKPGQEHEMRDDKIANVPLEQGTAT